MIGQKLDIVLLILFKLLLKLIFFRDYNFDCLRQVCIENLTVVEEYSIESHFLSLHNRGRPKNR